MSDDTEFDTRKLDQLLKALGKSDARARVGVLGSNNARSVGDAPSNATVGLVHEFGSPSQGIPQRSFLRMPITLKMQAALEASGAFTTEVLREVMASKTLVPWLKLVGITGEGIVHDAFNTGGFGFWKPSKMAHKAVKQTLVETRQLERSITSDVVE